MPSVITKISTPSKKKLKSFEFAPLNTTDSHEGEDGRVARPTGVAELGNKEEANMQPPELLRHTPAIISLLDLVADPEENSNQPPSCTPADQVTWSHVAGLMATPSSSAKTTQRGNKRAASSSPRSSQGHLSKDAQAKRGVLNTKSSSQSLRRSPNRRSPNQDDPAAVLWKAYADNKGHEPALPPLPFLNLSQKALTSNDKDFRRTASCGTEWPTSSSKRRKLRHHDPYSTTKQIFALKRREILQPHISRQSRVSLLLDSVEQNFAARRQEEDDAPSSSSPLPERFHAPADRISPAEELPPAISPVRKSQASGKGGGSPLKNMEKTSDYGDLELDDDDLEEIEHVLTQGQAQIEPIALKRTPATLRHADTAHPACIGQTDEVELLRPPDPVEQSSKHDVNLESAIQEASQIFDDFDEDIDLLDDDDDLQELVNKDRSQQSAGSISQPAHGGTSEHKDYGEPKETLVNDLDSSFEGDDVFNEIDDLDVVMTNYESIPIDNRAIKRYLILDVLEEAYEFLPGRKRPQKLLSIKDERTKQLYRLILRQSWYESRCTKGSFVHLIGDFDGGGQCVVDDDANMVILHPDHLVSATVVGDAISCLRRAVLQDRVKATAPPERPQVFGHILHEVFGEAMRRNNWEMSTFEEIVAQLLPNYLESLYEVGLQIPDATEHLMSKVPLMKAWADLFVSPVPQPDAVIRGRKDALVPTAINKLLELEEHVWSPMYGLKGNIDATVQAQLQLPESGMTKTLLLPLELKTGAKENVEAHRAQTALYTLLLTDRYDVEVTNGILYYMETSKTFRIEGIRHELRQMVIWRNMIAGYIHDKLALPPVIKREHLCKRCYAQTSCFTYHKLVEGGTGETSGLHDQFDEAVGHLRPQHQTFFKKWDELLTREERDCMKFRRELWTMLSIEREHVGRCFSNMVIESGSAQENAQGPKINRFTYSFIKHDKQTSHSLTESQITVGEPIVISDEKGHFALANGYVTSIKPTRITVAVDRRLQNARKRTKEFDPENNQTFVGIMEVKVHGVADSSADEDDSPALYRIDKDEFSNGMATVRNNLIRMMEKGLFKARELRELIIEQRAPTFKHMSTAYQLSGPASQSDVNVDQRAAIEKVMTAKDYALVLGMPGTGKTTTIAHIIRALVSQGKSVLLTSYTHTAVDNILLKIKDDNIPILRLGSIGKVHPDVQTFADLSGIPKTSIEGLQHSWQNSKVVATTCLGINHGIFNHRIFDYCIVDEASQITLPVCLGPIRFAHAFILVGDHYQLPPLVQNKEAQEGGLDVSLFKLLSDAQPSSVVSLEHQYRMAEDIMLLSNELIYDGRLKCGTEAVARRVLEISNLSNGLEAHHVRSRTQTSQPHSTGSTCTATNSNCWIRTALRPFSRVLFLNTDTITSPHAATEHVHRSSSRITNQLESFLIAQLLTVMIRSGVPARSIGVITFYRSQLALLRRDVKSIAGTTAAGEVEMHTADKYQGRDKEVILLSCVRSNEACSVGELLKDWRRVNVVITRARSKLLIIGSQKTLQGSGVPVLQGLTKIMKTKGWTVDLPSDPSAGHVFARAMPTQTQTLPEKPRVQPAPQETPKQEQIVPQQPTVAKTSKTNEIKRVALAPLPINTASPTPHEPTAATTTSTHHPQFKHSANVKKPFKVPKRVVHGVQLQVEHALDQRPFLRDVMNEMGVGARTTKSAGIENDLAAFADEFDDDLDF